MIVKIAHHKTKDDSMFLKFWQTQKFIVKSIETQLQNRQSISFVIQTIKILYLFKLPGLRIDNIEMVKILRTLPALVMRKSLQCVSQDKFDVYRDYIHSISVHLQRNYQKPTFHPLGDFLNPVLALLGQGLKKSPSGQKLNFANPSLRR
jgi:hypothetical protein